MHIGETGVNPSELGISNLVYRGAKELQPGTHHGLIVRAQSPALDTLAEPSLESRIMHGCNTAAVTKTTTPPIPLHHRGPIDLPALRFQIRSRRGHHPRLFPQHLRNSQSYLFAFAYLNPMLPGGDPVLVEHSNNSLRNAYPQLTSEAPFQKQGESA